MELKRTDSTMDQAIMTLGWNSATCRAYSPFIGGEESDIRLILMNKSVDSSGEEGMLLIRATFRSIRILRPRLLLFPPLVNPFGG